MRIGLTQMDIVWEDKAKNCERCVSILQTAKEQGVNLLVFPEMTLTGFSMNAAFISQGEPDYSRSFFEAASKKYDMAIVFGYTEKVNGQYRNKLSIVNHGEIIADYAKIHPFSYGEEGKHYTGGEVLSLAGLRVSSEEWTVGSAVCYDLRFPELFQALSDDAQLIIVIANWPKERVMHWDTLLRARAIENQCFICGVNRVGEGNSLLYECSSVLYDPWGNALTERGGDVLLTADIHPETVASARAGFAMKKDRKDALYSMWYQKKACREREET